MKRLKKILLILAGLLLVLLALDYTAYRYGEAWYATIQRDLPIGTTIEAARSYLQDEAQQHGIIGLYEDTRPNMRGFIFEKQNMSIIFSLVKDGVYGDHTDSIAIRFDSEGHLNSLETFKDKIQWGEQSAAGYPPQSVGSPEP